MTDKDEHGEKEKSQGHEDDLHSCLICRQLIVGLDAYIEHRQNNCGKVDDNGTIANESPTENGKVPTQHGRPEISADSGRTQYSNSDSQLLDAAVNTTTPNVVLEAVVAVHSAVIDAEVVNVAEDGSQFKLPEAVLSNRQTNETPSVLHDAHDHPNNDDRHEDDLNLAENFFSSLQLRYNKSITVPGSQVPAEKTDSSSNTEDLTFFESIGLYWVNPADSTSRNGPGEIGHGSSDLDPEQDQCGTTTTSSMEMDDVSTSHQLTDVQKFEQSVDPATLSTTTPPDIQITAPDASRPECGQRTTASAEFEETTLDESSFLPARLSVFDDDNASGLIRIADPDDLFLNRCHEPSPEKEKTTVPVDSSGSLLTVDLTPSVSTNSFQSLFSPRTTELTLSAGFHNFNDINLAAVDDQGPDNELDFLSLLGLKRRHDKAHQLSPDPSLGQATNYSIGTSLLSQSGEKGDLEAGNGEDPRDFTSKRLRLWQPELEETRRGMLWDDESDWPSAALNTGLGDGSTLCPEMYLGVTEFTDPTVMEDQADLLARKVTNETEEVNEEEKENESHYSCSACKRKFVSFNLLEKHLLSELHFKNASSSSAIADSSRPSRIIKRPKMFDDFEDASWSKVKKPFSLKSTQDSSAIGSHYRPSTVSQGPENNLDNPSVDSLQQLNVPETDSSKLVDSEALSDPKPSSSKGRWISCECCNAKVDRVQFAKHLISHYHYHRSLSHPARQSQILANIKLIVKQAPFQCQPCQFFCNWTTDLLKHCLTHREEGTFYCQLCSRIIPSQAMLVAHLKSAEHQDLTLVVNRSVPTIINKISLQRCSVCDAQFRLNISLKQHMIRTHGVTDFHLDDHTRFACTLCPFWSHQEGSLRMHQFIVHPRSKLQYSCRICHLQFTTRDSVKKHRNSTQHKLNVEKWRETGEEQKTMTCDLCSLVFPVAGQKETDALAEHLMKDHSSEIKCFYEDHSKGDAQDHGVTQPKLETDAERVDLDGKRSMTTDFKLTDIQPDVDNAKMPDGLDDTGAIESNLERIVLKSSDEYEGEIVKPSCQIFIDGKSEPEKEIGIKEEVDPRVIYEDNVVVVSDRMEISTATVDNIDSRAVYANSVVLTSCSSQNGIDTTLHRERTSAGISEQAIDSLADSSGSTPTENLCCYCGKYYSSRSSLNSHIVNMHSNKGIEKVERPYHCSEPGCSYSARYPSDLKRHEVVHKADKNLACDHCEFVCKRESELTRHMKIKHSEVINVNGSEDVTNVQDEDSSKSAKTHACLYCNYQSSWGASHLRRHLTTVHGITLTSTLKGNLEETYQCNLCKYQTKLKWHLKRHQERVHKDKDQN